MTIYYIACKHILIGFSLFVREWLRNRFLVYRYQFWLLRPEVRKHRQGYDCSGQI